MAALGLFGLFVVVLGAWTINYSYYNHHCFQAKQERGCERFVPMEKWVCGHELPQTMLLGGCGMVAARYSFGVGVPKDLAQSIAYSRRDCTSPLTAGSEGSCVLARGYYGKAYFEPHYVLSWSGRFQGPSYAPRWLRPLDTVTKEAEAACASDFAGDTHSANLRDLLHKFCSELRVGRLAAADARAHLPELINRCTDENESACHLAGYLLTFGIGTERQVRRGKALLERACKLGSALACDDLSKKGAAGAVMRDLQAAEAGAQ